MEEGHKPWLEVPEWGYTKMTRRKCKEQFPNEAVAFALVQLVTPFGLTYLRCFWWNAEAVEPFVYSVEGDTWCGRKLTEMKSGEDVALSKTEVFVVHKNSSDFLKILELKE